MTVEIPFLKTYVPILGIDSLQCWTKTKGRLYMLFLWLHPQLPLPDRIRKPYLLHRGRQTMTEVAIDAVSGAGKGKSEPDKTTAKKCGPLLICIFPLRHGRTDGWRYVQVIDTAHHRGGGGRGRVEAAYSINHDVTSCLHAFPPATQAPAHIRR